jgi:(p)ppGpp synthase/HD superfamily hydrolase
MPMIYTHKIQRAIKFSVKTHEVYQKQKRKGKDVAYITHPMTVGLILSLAGASEDVVVAGILHDTIEDSVQEKKVTTEMISQRFGEHVASLVDSVTEQDKSASWEVRKAEAIGHIPTFSHDSLLVKSADILSNVSETIDDHARFGEEIFERFNAPKEKIISHYLQAIDMIIKRWPDSPLAGDLAALSESFRNIKE